MSVKSVVDHEVGLRVISQERLGIRQQVISTFLEEMSGDDSLTHRYTYWVETLADGSRIYLRRPASLHKGMDFAILAERFWKHKNGNDRPPRHRDLAHELRAIASKSARHRSELLTALERVWECALPDAVLEKATALRAELSAERALKLARWMFIEQDLAYWTGQGRRMLKRALEKELSERSGDPPKEPA